MIKYLSNCFLLLLPIFLWNILLVDHLPHGYSPEVFDENVPQLVRYTENILRALVFGLPVLMVLSFETQRQKLGLLVYLVGVVLYFLSWGVLIVVPEMLWSMSRIGFMAPAFTTLIWFVGIGMIGQKTFVKIPYLSKIYLVLALLFVVVHSLHCYMAFESV